MFDYLQIVNPEHRVSRDYEPTSLIEILNREHNIVRINEVAWQNFCKLADRGIKEGQFLDLTSGYRSFEHQQRTLNAIVSKKGISAIGKRVAIPGTSEHQTGLALDVSNFSKEGIMRSDPNRFDWMHQYCYDYGFILRYKAEFEKVTGVTFEPWHLRYVGREHALKMRDMNIALEDYIKLL